jgi:hypothetical protein
VSAHALSPRQIEARAKLLALGIISPFYLRPSQQEVYDLLTREKNPLIECSRRFGKTTTTLVYGMERLRAQPGMVLRWGEPWKDQARKIVMPELEKIQELCPKRYKFKFYRTDSFYAAPNDSKIYLHGLNEDRGESARGSFADVIVVDEMGSLREPQYIINEVLRPQLLTTNGQMVLISTPPRNLAHMWYIEREKAIRDGRFIRKIVTDNESLTEEQIEKFIEEMGGRESPACKRELFCEDAADPDKLIIPEFTNYELQTVVPDDYPRPEFFTPYVGGDSGFDDNTALLFAYHDFEKNEVVFDSEYLTNGKTTREIITNAKRIEGELWGATPCREPLRRVYDADKQLLMDIIGDLKYSVALPKKDDKRAAINGLRRAIQEGRVKIKRRCLNLIRQLKVGQWKDDRHSDFERSDELGHLDAIAAAVYLYRTVIPTYNPWPQFRGIAAHTHFISPSLAPMDRDSAALDELYHPATDATDLYSGEDDTLGF